MNSSARKDTIAILIVVVFTVALPFGLFAEGGKEEATAAVQIDWNSPNMVERLTADRYILPDGWEEATAGVKEITFGNAGGMSGDIATLMNLLRFEELTGIHVDYLELPPPIIDNKALVALSTKDKNMHAPMVRLMMTLATFSSAGWLEPLDELWTPEVEELYGALELVKYDGRYYGGQVTVNGATSFYRDSWFQKAGIGKAPDNYTELYPALKKVQQWARENVGGDVYACTFEGRQALMRPLISLMHSQGKYIYEDGAYQFDTPEWRNSFSYLANLVLDGLTTPETISFTFNEAGRFFGMGKCAYVPFLVNSYQMKYETEFPEVEDDWIMQVPPKWSPDDPVSNYSTGIAGGGTAVPVHIDANEKAAVMLFIDYMRSKEACRNEVVVEGNETNLFSLYEESNPGDKVDWALANRAADIIKKPHPPHTVDIPNKDVRKTIMQYGRSEVFPAGFPEVRARIDENFVKAATGQLTVDEAIQDIIDFESQF